MGRYVIPCRIKRKLAAWNSIIPQGRRLTFDKILPSETTLLSALAKADADLIESWL